MEEQEEGAARVPEEWMDTTATWKRWSLCARGSFRFGKSGTRWTSKGTRKKKGKMKKREGEVEAVRSMKQRVAREAPEPVAAM